MFSESNSGPVKTGFEKYEDIDQYNEKKLILIEQYRRKERKWYTVVVIISAVLILGLIAFAIVAFWG